MAKRSGQQSEAVAEIGPLPPVHDPERREAGRYDPVAFAQEYFGYVPYGCFIPMTDAHREAYAGFDKVCTYGRQSPIRSPRLAAPGLSLELRALSADR